jgi:hypothetical protein
MTTEQADDERDRLRRELRAMGAVNRQLQAQLDEPTAVVRHRRANRGTEWIEKLVTNGAVDSLLVQSADGKVYLIEAEEKRAVNAGIVAAALEEALGVPGTVSNDQLTQWADGVPVEIFEAADGAPFVVVGGKRCTVRGVPLPYPVDNRHASALPRGDDLNVAAANVSRRRYREATSPRFQIDRAKAVIAEKGVVASGKAAVRRVGKLLK